MFNCDYFFSKFKCKPFDQFYIFFQLPRELFFHTDYRPLIWDNLGGACDEQTGIPPHLMSPPFLVDVEGNPHPSYLQKLVPGREYDSLDTLVPELEMSKFFFHI